MSDIRKFFENCQKAFGKNAYNDFMLTHGHAYNFGPHTFKGPRQEANNCYGNALHTAMDKGLTYVEGKVLVHGVPIDHAWCVDADGFVVDPTIVYKGQVTEYFGVPFLTKYAARAVARNGIYGLLDIVFADQTAPKLYELGLEAGQKWLLDQPFKVKRAKQRRTA